MARRTRSYVFREEECSPQGTSPTESPTGEPWQRGADSWGSGGRARKRKGGRKLDTEQNRVVLRRARMETARFAFGRLSEAGNPAVVGCRDQLRRSGVNALGTVARNEQGDENRVGYVVFRGDGPRSHSSG